MVRMVRLHMTAAAAAVCCLVWLLLLLGRFADSRCCCTVTAKMRCFKVIEDCFVIRI
jgi:hypothetical protein